MRVVGTVIHTGVLIERDVQALTDKFGILGISIEVLARIYIGVALTNCIVKIIHSLRKLAKNSSVEVQLARNAEIGTISKSKSMFFTILSNLNGELLTVSRKKLQDLKEL